MLEVKVNNSGQLGQTCDDSNQIWEISAIFHQILVLTKCLELEVKTWNSFNFIHLVSHPMSQLSAQVWSKVSTPWWVIERLSVIKSVSNSNFTLRRDNSDVIYVERFIQQTDIYKDWTRPLYVRYTLLAISLSIIDLVDLPKRYFWITKIWN